MQRLMRHLDEQRRRAYETRVLEAARPAVYLRGADPADATGQHTVSATNVGQGDLAIATALPAMSFPGSGYMNVGALGSFGSGITGGAMTFSCYLKTSDTTQFRLVGMVDDTTTPSSQFFGVTVNQVAMDSVYLNINDTQSQPGHLCRALSTGLVDGAWHHLLVVLDADSSVAHKLYIDGQNVATMILNTTGNCVMADFNYDVYLGAQNNAGTADGFLTGQMSEAWLALGDHSSLASELYEIGAA